MSIALAATWNHNYLVCAIHPSGPENDPCPDFAEATENWEPVGGAYYAGDLIRDWAGHLMTEERPEILATHPLFAGICPKCGASFEGAGQIHYDCVGCGGWDDSIN